MNKTNVLLIKLLCISLTCGLLPPFGGGEGGCQNIGINGNGAAPDASAILDVSAVPSNDKGMLIPRIALTATNMAAPVTAPAVSLLVYNTATAGTAPNNVIPGYYYWDGTQWVVLGGDDWHVTGNTGTTPATNFIGTTDAQNLAIRTNNLKRLEVTQTGRLDFFNTSGGNTNLFVEGGNETTTGLGFNTAIGVGALSAITSGFINTAVGWSALSANTTGTSNSAVGWSALAANTTGGSNTAIGSNSLPINTTGGSNTAVGVNALNKNTTGFNNVALGVTALGNTSIGNDNTAIGSGALGNNTTGIQNVAIGSFTLRFNISDSNNTALGYNSFAQLGPYFNSTALGANTVITASNQIRLGNNLITSIGGFRAWTNLSDGRFKQNIKENVLGLDFILKLRPVSYNLNYDAYAKYVGLPDDIRNKENEKMRSEDVHTGFIAQEVEQLAKELNFNFSGIDTPKNENDYYGLRYAEFVVPLVKAVQEQQQMIEGQQKIIEELQKKVEMQSKLIQELQSK